MRVIFVGTVEFSKKMLSVLVSSEVNIVGVITSDHPGINADYTDLVPLCRSEGIEVHSARNINGQETIEWIRSREPDMIFCFGWSYLIKKELLNVPKKGILGYHPAALPSNRGRHPLIWAVVLGLSETASTFFLMDEGADSGDIVSQERVAIRDGDDVGDLYQKIIVTAGSQLRELIPKLDSGKFPRQVQASGSGNTWRKRVKPDGQIDWRMSSRGIHNLVRGLTRPYVGAHFKVGGQDIKVWRTEMLEAEGNLEPGKVLIGGMNGAVIKCGDSAIRLVESELKTELNAGEYL